MDQHLLISVETILYVDDHPFIDIHQLQFFLMWHQGLHLDHLGVGPQAHILNQRSPKDQSRGIDLGGAGCQNSAAFWVLWPSHIGPKPANQWYLKQQIMGMDRCLFLSYLWGWTCIKRYEQENNCWNESHGCEVNQFHNVNPVLCDGWHHWPVWNIGFQVWLLLGLGFHERFLRLALKHVKRSKTIQQPKFSLWCLCAELPSDLGLSLRQMTQLSPRWPALIILSWAMFDPPNSDS